DEDPIERQAHLRALQGGPPPGQGLRDLHQPPPQAAAGLTRPPRPTRDTIKTKTYPLRGGARRAAAATPDGNDVFRDGSRRTDGCLVSSASTSPTTSAR